MILYPENYIVFDFETTGLDPKTTDILEIAAIRVDHGQIMEEFSRVLKRQVPEKITEITGITQEMSDQGAGPETAFLEFMSFLPDGMPMIGHNIIRFDLEFLAEAMAKYTGMSPEELAAKKKRIQNSCIDTAALYKAKLMGTEQLWYENHFLHARRVMETRAFGVKYNLGLCCDELGIPKIDQHRAMADVSLTNQVYRKLCLETQNVTA